MSHEVKLHAVQTSILRALLFQPSASYASLQQLTDLSSDHFNFHVTRLVELGFVEKVQRGTYRLTIAGKEYANRLDTDNNTVERQPKSAVIFGLSREHDGQIEYLFQKRRKNPYYGFWGLPSGKVRWGETILETARRESQEETGLDADFTVISVYHETVQDSSNGSIIEDKIFFMVLGKNIRGELLEEFEGGHNEWRTVESVLKESKKYSTLEAEIDLLTTDTWFNEQTVTYSSQEF
jgi:8-oxo-dGTP pyrophosphatase MutT (NUDIX family)